MVRDIRFERKVDIILEVDIDEISILNNFRPVSNKRYTKKKSIFHRSNEYFIWDVVTIRKNPYVD